MNKHQAQIVMNITSGKYNENLTIAMTHAAKAVQDIPPEEERYLLSQSIAQSLIALNLQFERVVEMIERDREDKYGHG